MIGEEINTFVQRVYKGIKSKKKLVKFGISPSGLYKPGKPGGMPPPITGFDQYDETYADPNYMAPTGVGGLPDTPDILEDRPSTAELP